MDIKTLGKLSVKALNEHVRERNGYTIGEIIRRGLLKNHQGKPYKHKATILRLVNKSKRIKTPWGNGYSITQKEIDTLNNRWK
jgi:hypothetical protein